MSKNAKTAMISARLPTGLVDRVDFAVRNIDSSTVRNRSEAVEEALQQWTAAKEQELERLGIAPPRKARP